MAESNNGLSIAKKNLATAWSSPVMKIGVVVGGLLIFITLALAVHLLRGKAVKAGAVEGDSYSVSSREPRGEVDAATAAAVATKSDERAEDAKALGTSFGGPFTYDSGPQKQNQPAGTFEESGVANARQVAAVVADLKAKASEYDSAEQQRQGGDRGVSRAAYNQSGGGQQAGGAQAGYGLSEDAFKQVSGQLQSVGGSVVAYGVLPNGALTRPPAVAQAKAAEAPVGGGVQPSVASGAMSATAKEEVAARAGDICAATPEATVNTDYSVPVFFELHDCGLLTGARAKGTVQKTPDDFVITFTAFTLDPKRGYKLVSNVDGISVNVKKDGSPGIADDVDRHWASRLGASSLLALARTERSFIAARGSSAINTGTSTTVSIDPLSAEEKRKARVAGLLEGSMDVVSRDLGYGINRQATMSLDKSTVIGIQFTSDVRVVPNEQR